MHVQRAGGIAHAAHRRWRGEAHDVLAGLQQVIERDERIVHAAARQESCRAACRCHRTGGRGDIPRSQLLEWAGESVEDPIELHAHLERQCPTRVVVRWRGRRAGKGKDVRVHLRLEHVQHVRPEGLRRVHDVRAGGILLAPRAELLRRALDGDARLEQCVHKLRGRRKIRLVAGNDIAPCVAQRRRLHRRPFCRVGGRGQAVGDRTITPRVRRPGVPAATRDGAPSHRVDVIEQVLAHARRIVEHRAIQRDRIVDRLLEVPLLRRDRQREVARRNLSGEHQRDAHRRGATDDLRQHRDGVVKRGGVANAAVPPPIVRAPRPHRRPTLALHRQPRVHRGAE